MMSAIPARPSRAVAEGEGDTGETEGEGEGDGLDVCVTTDAGAAWLGGVRCFWNARNNRMNVATARTASPSMDQWSLVNLARATRATVHRIVAPLDSGCLPVRHVDHHEECTVLLAFDRLGVHGRGPEVCADEHVVQAQHGRVPAL